MRGQDLRSSSLFSYVDLERRIRPDHPLRTIRTLVDEALTIARQMFTEERPSFEGRYYRIHDALNEPRPVQPARLLFFSGFSRDPGQEIAPATEPNTRRGLQRPARCVSRARLF